VIDPHVVLERDGPIGRLRLTRPEKRNAQTPEMWDALRRIGAELLQRPDLRVLVVEGEGPVFSAGIDLSVLLSQANGGAALSIEPELVQQAFTWLREVPFPTIAAVQGAAIGAGCQLALACDLRVLADDAVMGLPEITFGIFPDLGGCAWLPELVGTAKAKELIFTGARIDASEAHRIGLANRVVPASELAGAVTALATELASKAPLGIAAAKRSIAAAVASPEAALQISAREVRRLLVSEDFREAGRAVVEKRAPRYAAR
jgi:enoyl-CoA hydratase/carnithine racemase